jgi:hypothetical protein
MPMSRITNLKTTITRNFNNLSEDGFHKIFNQINQYGIKQSVDRMGLDKFIEQCARVSAGSGAISGSGGLLTMAIGIPADLVMSIMQLFRVTLAIIYHKRGSYQIAFEEFMVVVGTSVKVEAGVTLTKTMLEEISERLLLRLGSKAAGRLIPVVGAVIGGTANYMFIKGFAESIKKMDFAHIPVTEIKI